MSAYEVVVVGVGGGGVVGVPESMICLECLFHVDYWYNDD